MKYLLTFVIVFVILLSLNFGIVHLDLFLNPWLRNAAQEWKWYNYFTSHHTVTILYLKGLWLIPALIISALISLLLINYVSSKK